MIFPVMAIGRTYLSIFPIIGLDSKSIVWQYAIHVEANPPKSPLQGPIDIILNYHSAEPLTQQAVLQIKLLLVTGHLKP